MFQVSDIEGAIRGCLDIIGVSVGDCLFGVYDCRSIDVHGAGAYVFFDGSGVYYVGEADDVACRLLKEHCSVHIGGSEGVVRFLMHYLNEICANSSKWVGLDAVGREEFIKKILGEKINSLRIYVVTCKELSDSKQGNRRVRNKLRIRLEECLKEKLRPILNP
ncbi:hypothetical protein VMUT_2270 [Vulcanisaeta moutnovskia 768-28]|uniref:GIY-YIG domain-containing protein n=1 Tax=Vulcanisaeta moutnovskia (strain 768-28) TaxID=985053 RepID=F0QXY0_VULM7|nr:hypothetical protein [Vulcanisaeta moutnovskia]ADY02466.1 hypothetical protein VMUT_2270 [Vulcanisaeta moutnovskia 768-28]